MWFGEQFLLPHVKLAYNHICRLSLGAGVGLYGWVRRGEDGRKGSASYIIESSQKEKFDIEKIRKPHKTV